MNFVPSISTLLSAHRRGTTAIHSAPVFGLFAAILVAVGFIAYVTANQGGSVPAGFAKANGRIEVERIDVGAKYSGRVAEILVQEGDYVEKNTVLARLDMTELNAELSAAEANVLRAIEAIKKAEAEVALREAEHKLFEIELERATTLTQRNVLSESELDKRNAEHAVSEATILAAEAALGDATAALAVARAQVSQLEATISEMTLKAPVAGRIEYKLVQPGTILAAGGRVVSILDLSDAYMTIFLPTSQSGRVALGSDARIVLDAAPTTIIPATVSFVASEAQFTPKVVETFDEREKLMYRVKLKIDPKLLETYSAYVKAGLTGDAFVKISRNAEWPDSLNPSLPDAD